MMCTFYINEEGLIIILHFDNLCNLTLSHNFRPFYDRTNWQEHRVLVKYIASNMISLASNTAQTNYINIDIEKPQYTVYDKYLNPSIILWK